jgi:hypothetical protein
MWKGSSRPSGREAALPPGRRRRDLPGLAEAARRGLAARIHQHRCRDVEIVVADVTAFRVPDDLTMAYFFHPFRGETFERVLRGIVESIDRNPRRVRLIYVVPQDQVRSQILATGRFRLLKEQYSRLLDGPPSRGRSPVAIFESR